MNDNRAVVQVIANKCGTYTVYSDGTHTYLGWTTLETFWKVQSNPNYLDELSEKHE